MSSTRMIWRPDRPRSAGGPALREPPATVCERKVEWYDTDAAGHHHHSAILRWVEAAEAELFRRHGLEGLFGRIPRVRYEADYRARLVFGQPVRIGLRVAELGRTSLHYEFEVLTADGTIAAKGLSVVVYAPTLE